MFCLYEWIEAFLLFPLMLSVDNAYDPDVDAKQIWIDKTQIKDKECLTFMDDGNGLNYHKMHRMLRWILIIYNNNNITPSGNSIYSWPCREVSG